MVEHIGGQAVIEGVMMRSPTKVAVSVRLQNGKIKTKKEKFKKINKYSKMPLIRGSFVLVDTLVKGMKALIWSADQQLGKDEKITTKEIVFSLLIAFGFGIILFLVVPLYLAGFVSAKGTILYNVVDGILRVIALVAYMAVISLMKDIKVVFQYHGAEHKAVNCYEAGKKLTLANAKKFTTIHKRCGTSFLFIVVIISIIIFSFILSPKFYINLLVRIILLPVVAGISYEILKLGEKTKIIRWATWPGQWLQKITTKEPTNKQIEVAITSLKSVL